MTRVMLVDDHELVRQGIAAMLTGAGDVQVVAVARTGREALEVALLFTAVSDAVSMARVVLGVALATQLAAVATFIFIRRRVT